MRKIILGSMMTALLLPVAAFAQSPPEGKNTVIIRGHNEDVYYYPATGARLNRKILFAPGDGGWRGYAITVATNMASWGYDVYGLDTKVYLESFTGRAHLKETDVMTDFRQIADWMTHGSGERVSLVGWSEGAGLCLLAAAANENKKTFSGLASFGLSETAVLGWRWSDFFTYITRKDPNEPKFQTAFYLPRVAPLPLLILQSSHDEYIPVDEEKRLFSAAAEPKRFVLIEAQNHRFDGHRDEFFRALREGLEWINKTTGETPARGRRPEPHRG